MIGLSPHATLTGYGPDQLLSPRRYDKIPVIKRVLKYDNVGSINLQLPSADDVCLAHGGHLPHCEEGKGAFSTLSLILVL
jgi:hypothetical protein